MGLLDDPKRGSEPTLINRLFKYKASYSRGADGPLVGFKMCNTGTRGRKLFYNARSVEVDNQLNPTSFEIVWIMDY